MHLKKILRCLRDSEEPTIALGTINRKEIESQLEIVPEKSKKWLQFAAAISACLAVIGCGGHLGWTSPALPYLTSPSLPTPLAKSEGAWVVSSYTIGGIIGSLLTPLVLDRIGRKYSLLTFALPQVAGWGLIIASRKLPILYTARFIAGVGHGGIFNLITIYLGEIADKSIRGALGTFLKVSANIGTLFVTSVGAYLPYDSLNLVSISIPILFMVTFAFMPETPYFFLIKGRVSDAEKALMTLRRLKDPASVREDIKIMKEAVEEGERNKKNLFKELVRTRGNRRGLVILLGLKATQQFSGHMALVAYTQEIFSHSGSSLPPEQAVVLLGVCQLIAGIVAAGLVDRLGRRILMLVSGISAALSLVAVGAFFYLKYHLLWDVSGITWLPIAALIAYDVMEVLGIGTLPYVLLGELFPTNVKGTAVSLGIVVGSIFASLVGLGFQAMNASVGIHWTFWIFAICCAMGTIFVYIVTPETKGKTLEEIQSEMNPQKRLSREDL